MLNGAELVIVPNACKFDHLRIVQLQTRAFENATCMVMTNYPGPESGCSVAFDATGDCAGKAGRNEGLYLAHFDMAACRKYRGKAIWGNAWRRPHRYKALTSQDVKPPFDNHTTGLNRPFDRRRR